MRYTNGVGHLIMSILMTIAGLLLILLPTDATTRGIGVTLVLTVQGAWFISGSVKQLAHEIVKQTRESQTQPLSITTTTTTKTE